jgi:excinuclease UvrABC nuclease subunit
MNFSSEDLKSLSGFGVYLFSKDNKIIYIGATVHGLGRCLAPNHRVASLFKEGLVTLDFVPLDSREEAFALEEQLIEDHQPELNRTQKDGYRRYRMRYRAENSTRESSYILDEEVAQRLKGMTNPIWPEHLKHLRPRL